MSTNTDLSKPSDAPGQGIGERGGREAWLDVEPLDSGECGIGSVAFGGPRKPHKADEGRTMRSRLCKAWRIPAGRHAKGTMTVSAGYDGLNLEGLGWCALGPGIEHLFYPGDSIAV